MTESDGNTSKNEPDLTSDDESLRFMLPDEGESKLTELAENSSELARGEDIGERQNESDNWEETSKKIAHDSTPNPVLQGRHLSPESSEQGEILENFKSENDLGEENLQVNLNQSGLAMPDFTEHDWREILDLLDKRIEPCDVTGELVQASYKRHFWRSLENSYAKIKVRLVQHLVRRAEHRFKDRIEQDEAVSKIQRSLQEWTAEHSQSIAWKFHERSIAELDLAREMRRQSIERVTNRISFRNLNADHIYREFVKYTVIPPIFGMYVFSVLVLTDKKFHFALKYVPPFNQGLAVLGTMIAGIVSIFVFKGAWKYTTAIRETQWDFIQAKKAYDDAVRTITHAFKEEVRLEQQIINIEPLLEVLAHGYSSSWQIDDRLEVDVFTHLNTDDLPACVGFARAVEGSDELVAKLQDLALRQVVRPGWRTELIQKLGQEYGEKTRTILNFDVLDRDFGSSVVSAKNRFIEAFRDLELAKRVGAAKIYELVFVIHQSVLRNRNTDLRPPVKSTRKNGFEDIDTSSDWLSQSDANLNWVDFMSEILQEAPPFSALNLTNLGRRSGVSESGVESYAVIPQYMLGQSHPNVHVESNVPELIAPVDVAVRVDVSDWGTLDSFLIFEADENLQDEVNTLSTRVVEGFNGI